MTALWTSAEQAVLASVMLNERTYGAVCEEGCKPNWFTTAKGRALWTAISHLVESGEEGLDPVSIATELANRRWLPKPVSYEDLDAVTAGMPRTTNIRHYCGIVREAYTRRQIKAIGGKITTAYLDGQASSDLLANCHEWLAGVVDSETGAQWSSTADLAPVMLDHYQETQSAKGKKRGLTTGFAPLDERWCGLQPGNITIVAGRPGMGKTYFALQVAQHVSNQTGVAFFSLEMQKNQLMERLHSINSGVPLGMIRNGWMRQTEWAMLTASMGESDRFFVSDKGGQAYGSIRGRLRDLSRSAPIGLVVIDYLGLIDPGGSKSESTAYRIQRLVYQLKDMAKDFDLHVMLLCQLNREVEKRQNKQPILADLRESGGIEQVADRVVFIHRPGYYITEKVDESADEPAEIITAKFRHGRVGKDTLMWRPMIPRFDEFDVGILGE